MKKKITVRRVVKRPPVIAPRPPQPSPPPSPISLAWLKQEFQQLHREHAVIVKTEQDIQKLCKLILAKTTPDQDITPELESAVNAVYKQAVQIDQQVPDKNVPPVRSRSI